MKLLTFGINKHKLLLIQLDTPRRAKAQRFRAYAPAESPQEYYKISVLIPFIDEFLQQLNDRFSMDNRHVIQCLFSIIPSLIVDNANIQGMAADLTQLEEVFITP